MLLLVLLPIVLLYSVVEIASAAYRGNSQLSIQWECAISLSQSEPEPASQSLPSRNERLPTGWFGLAGHGR